MTPPPDAERYFFLAQDEAKDKEEDEEAISCWSKGDCGWSSDEEGNASSKEGLS